MKSVNQQLSTNFSLFANLTGELRILAVSGRHKSREDANIGQELDTSSAN